MTRSKKTWTNESFKMRTITCTWVCELNSLTHSAHWRRLVNNDLSFRLLTTKTTKRLQKIHFCILSEAWKLWSEFIPIALKRATNHHFLFCQNQIPKERVNCQKRERERERFRTNKREYVCVFFFLGQTRLWLWQLQKQPGGSQRLEGFVLARPF